MAETAIITPVFSTPENGRKKLLVQTINSVQRQNYEDFLHLIVDDGSTDGVKDVVDKFAKKDSRVIYLKRQRGKNDRNTCSNALNKGIDYIINGDSADNQTKDIKFLTVLHSDDLLAQDSIENRVSAMKSSNAGFVHTDMVMFYQDGRIRIRKCDVGDDYKKLMTEIAIRGINYHTLMWDVLFMKDMKKLNSTKWKKDFVYEPSIMFGEDQDVTLLSVKTAMESRNKWKVGYHPEVSVFYRIHASSITGELALSKKKCDLNAIKKKYFGNNLIELKQIFTRPHSYLPEKVKEMLRPVRDKIERIGVSSNNYLKQLNELASQKAFYSS